MMVADAMGIGICFNNTQSNALSDVLYFSIFISYRFIYYPRWHCFLFIQHGFNHYFRIHCTYVNRLLICGMSQVFMFCFLTCSYSLIKNPSTSPTYNGGFWPVEFKPFCLYSWCFLAQLAETSCLFDALSVHANVALDNGSQLIHSFLWHTHTVNVICITPGDWGPVTTEITQSHTESCYVNYVGPAAQPFRVLTLHWNLFS